MNQLEGHSTVQFRSGRWGGVRVAVPDDSDGTVLRAQDGRGRVHEMFLPPGIRCDVVARKSSAQFSFDRREAVVGRIGWRARMLHQLIYRLTSRRRYAFVYPTHWIFPVDADSRRRMSRIFGFLHSFNVNLSSADMLSNRWYARLDGTTRPASHEPKRHMLKIAAVVHLHYFEVWPDIAASLRHLPRDALIFVTLTPNARRLRKTILADFPSAQVEVVANRGRDVLPFLRLFKDGAFEYADLVLKIHGKRSDHGSRLVIGDYWRRATLSVLCGSSDTVDAIISAFARDPRLGVVGPARFRLPNAHIDAGQALGQNADAARQLFQLIFGTDEGFTVDFFAGTMFWFRREALEPLKNVEKPEELFETEKGLLDGLPEHAFERLLPAVANKSGYMIADTDGIQPDGVPARS
ncbi:MAG: rhamnan synthesis F family protein [Flavobacteriaceae bacterium]